MELVNVELVNVELVDTTKSDIEEGIISINETCSSKIDTPPLSGQSVYVLM